MLCFGCELSTIVTRCHGPDGQWKRQRRNGSRKRRGERCWALSARTLKPRDTRGSLTGGCEADDSVDLMYICRGEGAVSLLLPCPGSETREIQYIQPSPVLSFQHVYILLFLHHLLYQSSCLVCLFTTAPSLFTATRSGSQRREGLGRSDIKIAARCLHRIRPSPPCGPATLRESDRREWTTTFCLCRCAVNNSVKHRRLDTWSLCCRPACPRLLFTRSPTRASTWP